MKTYLLAIATLLSVSTYANAEWVKYGGKKYDIYNISYYYNTEKIFKTGNIVDVWTRSEFNGIQDVSRITQIDCSQSKYKIKEEPKWNDIPPGSIMETLEQRLCDNKEN